MASKKSRLDAIIGKINSNDIRVSKDSKQDVRGDENHTPRGVTTSNTATQAVNTAATRSGKSRDAFDSDARKSYLARSASRSGTSSQEIASDLIPALTTGGSILSDTKTKKVAVGGGRDGIDTKDVQIPTAMSRIANTVTGAVKEWAGGAVDASRMAVKGLQELNSLASGTDQKVQAANDNIARYEQEIQTQRRNGTLTNENLSQLNRLISANKRAIQAANENLKAQNSGTSAADPILSRTSDELQTSGQQNVSTAKQELGPVGSALVDIGVSGTQMALDAGVGALTGSSALVPMFIRSFGGGAQTARQAGADAGTQALYGLGSGVIETATEKISNAAAPFKKMFGSGVLDSAINAAVSDISQSAVGRALLTAGASAAGEGFEEFVGDLVYPVLQRATYNKDATFNLGDSLYDAMIGGALGLIGGTPGIVNSELNTGKTGAEFNAMGDDVIQATIETGLESDPSTESYKLATQLQQKLNNGETASNYELGRLYQANVRTVDAEQSGEELLRQAAEQVTQGTSITNRTASDILDNTRAVSILSEDAGLTLMDNMTKSQRRAAVKSAVEALASRSDAVSEPSSEITQTTEEQTQAAQESTPVTSRPVAQQAYDIKRVQRAASALGENGAKALTAAYNGSVDAQDYYAGFSSYYEAGVSGMDMDKVQSEYSDKLNQAQRFAAYSSGQQDAAASLTAEREGTNFVTVYGDEAGLVRNDYVAKLPKETAALYNRVARAVGVKIELVDSVRGGTANGVFLQGKNTIQLAMDADNALDVVAAHEITHRLQQLAPEAYRKYRDYVMNYRTGQNQGGSASIVEAYRSNAADAGVNLNTEEAMDEIAADFTQELIENKDLFGELAKKDRSIAGKLLDAIEEFISKVKSAFRGNAAAQDQAARSEYGVDMKTLEEAARLWTEAYNAAEEQVKSAKKADTESATSQKASPTAAATENEKGNPKFSTKRSIESYQAELETAKQELAVIESADVFHLEAAGYTSFTEWDKKRESAKRKVRRIEAKIKELSRPEFESAGTIDSKAFKAWFGDWRNPDARKSKVVDVDGKPLVVYHGTGTTIEEFLPELTGKGNDQYGSGFYFTSDKSTAEGYTTATINGQKKLGGDDNPNVIPVYLNIRNPLVVDGKKTPNLYGDDTRVSPEKAYSIIFKHPDIMDKENSILGDYFDTYWETGPKKYMISQLAHDYEWTLGTLETDIFSGYPEEFHRAVKEVMGYDGVQVNLAGGEKHFVAWFPNQIKHAKENSGAFSKNDNRIKYSLKADSKGRKLTPEQQEYFQDSKVVDDQGRLKAVYHGSPADFNEFNLRYLGSNGTNEGYGFYFTDKREIAEGYSHGTEAQRHQGENGRLFEVYLDIKKPLSDTSVTMTRAEFRKFISEMNKQVDSDGEPLEFLANYGDVEYEGLNKVLGIVMKTEYEGSDSDVNMIHSIINGSGSMETVFNVLRKTTGYDGIVVKDPEWGGDQIIYVAFHPDQIKSVTNKTPTSDPDIRYSLKPVPPVQPTSDDWKPGASFDEVKAAHPALFALDADEADTRNPTQITGTVKSYRKIYDALQAEGFDGTILDASSGLGYGTRAGREEYGFNVDDIEPFPDAKYTPMFMDYSALNKTYDVIINNAVLNVMPQDLRDALVVKMGQLLNPGGRAYINVRGTDVKNASSKVAINDDLMEYFISNTGSYQKGFTSRELVAYLKDALGDGFRVNPTNKFGGVSAIVTKDGRNSLKGTGNIQREMAALSEENDLLRDRVDYWKGQTKRTQRVTTDKKAVTQAARDLIRSYGADLETSEIAGDLQSLYDYISSGYDGKDELTYADARRRAEKIARTLVDNAVAVDDDQYRQYSDLRSYLRSTKLTLSETDSSNIADYNDFRKRNFGRLNLGSGRTNVDQVYQEMSAMWPEFFDEQRESHPADQLLHIVDVLDSIYDVTEYNPFSRFMDQATTGAANEIMEKFFELPQTRETFADRQARKLDEAKAKGRQQVHQVREQKDARMEELRKQNQQRVQNAIEKERVRREEQIDKLKTRYREKDAAGRERRSARELRAKIVRHAKALSQKLLRPSDKQHIPENLRQATAAMLDAINMESAFSVDPDTGKRVKDGSGTPTKRTEAFRKLKEAYANVLQDQSADMVLDPSLFGSEADGVQGNFDKVLSMGNILLYDMNSEQLDTVWQVVRAVEHSISSAGKVLSNSKFQRTSDWANAFASDTATRRDKRSVTKGHILLDMETPYTFFSHYGESGKAVYRMLRDAQDRQQIMVDEVAEAVDSLVTAKQVREFEKDTHEFTTERGEKLTLTAAQCMEIYELMKREQAQDHLMKGGIVQPEIQSAHIRRGTDSILLSANDLREIVGTLTDEQEKIADGLQQLTTGMLAEWGNEASMTAYGYKKFTDKDYWPIKSAKEEVHSNVEKGGNNTRSIKNIGMAQSVMPHASNALDIPGVFETFSSHTGDMADYAAWLLPMEDANRLYNFRYRTADGYTGKTIKGILDRVGGTGSQAYWRDLMEDIQNGINGNNDSRMASTVGKVIGNAKGAAVGGNLRVVLQQPTAFFRAAVVLSPDNMAKGLASGATKGNGWEKALKYSGIAMRKDQGGFEISSPRQMGEILFDKRSGLQRFNDKFSWAAGKADAITWGRMWNACEWQTKQNHRELKTGSKEFYNETAKLFAEVIDQSQVVDGVLQRSQIMRSSNALNKQATAFMGEPTMSFNLMLRAWDQLRYESNPEKRSSAIKRLGQTATALLVTSVVNALAQSIADAERADDDDDKKYWERFWAAFTGLSGDEESAWDKAQAIVLNSNLADNMNPMGQIPYVKDLLSLLQGYKVTRMDADVIADILDAGQTAAESAGGNGKKTRAYAVKELANQIGKLFGISGGNVLRDAWGIARSIAIETDNLPLRYEMEKAIYNIGSNSNKSRFMDLLFAAKQAGDEETYQRIYDDAVASGISDEDSIKAAMNSRYKKTDAYSSTQDGLASRQTAFLQENGLYGRMNASYREKANDWITGYSKASALADASPDYEMSKQYQKMDDLSKEGVEPWKYALFRAALSAQDDNNPETEKRNGSFDSDEIQAAIDSMSGLTQSSKALLFDAASSSKKNPYA